MSHAPFASVSILAVLLAAGCARMPVPTAARIRVEHAAVRLPATPTAVQQFAARELCAHLAGVFEEPVPLLPAVAPASAPDVYELRLGTAPGVAAPALRPGEGFYVVTATAAFLDGSDLPSDSAPASAQPLLHMTEGRFGTLAAAYAFLSREAGVRWIVPGDIGTVFLYRGALQLAPGTVRCLPNSTTRTWHAPTWEWSDLNTIQANLPPRLQVDQGTAATRADAETLWCLRHGLRPIRSAPAPGGRADSCFAGVGLPTGRDCEQWQQARAAKGRESAGMGFILPPSSWWLDGIGRYAAARAVRSPEAAFKVWETEFCAGFGAAAFHATSYYAFWRNWYKDRLRPEMERLQTLGYGDWRRGLALRLTEVCTLADLRQARALLDAGLARPQQGAAATRLEHLILSHRHAELIFLALEAATLETDQPRTLENTVEASRRLSEFRSHFQADLDLCLPRLLAQERDLGDLAGSAWAELFQDARPVRRLADGWRFRADPQDGGHAERWQATGPTDLAEWPEMRVDQGWQRQPEAGAATVDLTTYQGAAWYGTVLEPAPGWKDKELFLNLRGTTSTVDVYLDGQLLSADAQTRPVSFRVALPGNWRDANAPHTLMLHVTGTDNGPCGIWRPPWLSERRPPAPAPDADAAATPPDKT